MFRMREQIHRHKALRAVAQAGQLRGVAGQRFGAAAHVHHARRGHARHRAQAGRRAAGARRVQKHHVGAQALARGLFHPGGGVGAHKTRLALPVAARVGNGVAHGGGVALHPQHLARPRRGAQPNGANAAVGVHHGLPPVQPGQVQGGVVQHLGLRGVDLVKTARGYGKLQPAQGIRHKGRAPQRPFAVAQHGAGGRGVDVLHHAHDPRRAFVQRRAEIAAARQRGRGGHQRHQHLAAPVAAQHGVAQKAGAAVLVIGGPAAGARRGQHGLQCAVERFVLQKAAGGRQHAVGAGGVQAADQLAALFGKAGNGLVAVMPRLRHAAHRSHRGKAAQQRLQFGLFLRQLLRIRGGQQRAAAAMAGKVGAGGVHAFPSRG